MLLKYLIAMKNIVNFKLLVPTAGPVPAKSRADYIFKLAKKMRGEVLALHILPEALKTDATKHKEGQDALEIFSNIGLRLEVPVKTYLKEGELVPTLINFAESEKVDLIVMGVGEDRIVAEWIISDLKEHTKIPVVITPYGFSNII